MARRAFTSILLMAMIVGLGRAAAARMELGTWLDSNEPRVIAYLAKLTRADIGKRLAGVALTEPVLPGDVELKGYLFIGPADPQPAGAHVYRFHNTFQGRAFETHYIWLDAGAAPMDFPPCAAGYPDTGGISDLAGEQYTTSRIVSGLIVKTSCPLAKRGGTSVPGSSDPE